MGEFRFNGKVESPARQHTQIGGFREIMIGGAFRRS